MAEETLKTASWMALESALVARAAAFHASGVVG